MLSSQAIADEEMDASDQEKATPDPKQTDGTNTVGLNFARLRRPFCDNFSDPKLTIMCKKYFRCQEEHDPILVTFRNNNGEAETANCCRTAWRYKSEFSPGEEIRAIMYGAWIYDNLDALIDAYGKEAIFKSAIYAMILATYFLCIESNVPTLQLGNYQYRFDRENPLEKTLRLMHHFEGLEIEGNGWVGIIRGTNELWNPTMKNDYTKTARERIEHERAGYLKFLLMLAAEIYEAWHI